MELTIKEPVRNILVVDTLNSALQLHHNGVHPNDFMWNFVPMLKAICVDLRIHKVILATDAGSSKYRLKLHPGYKGDRRARQEKERTEQPAKAAAMDRFRKAITEFLKFAPNFGFEVVAAPGAEADDIIAYMVNHADLVKHRIAILSSDNDLLQLLRPNVVQRSISAKMGLKPTGVQVPPKVWVNTKRFTDAYGFLPEVHTDFKALAGDTGDSVYSPTGVGEGWAWKLFRHYGSLENIYAALPILDIPRIPRKIGPLLKEEWDYIAANRKLVNLRHSPEEEREIFTQDQLLLMDGVLATLHHAPQLNDYELQERMFKDGKVNLHSAYDTWTIPLRGIDART